jgi:hypothetical protein
MTRLKSAQRCLNAASSIFRWSIGSSRRTVPPRMNLTCVTPSGAKMISRTSQDLIQRRSLSSGVNALGSGGRVVTTGVVSCSNEVASLLPWQPTRASTNAIVVRVALLRILRWTPAGRRLFPSDAPTLAEAAPRRERVRAALGSNAPRRGVRELEFSAQESDAWRYGPSVTILPGPGCYAFQLDGTSFSDVIVFEAAEAST